MKMERRLIEWMKSMSFKIYLKNIVTVKKNQEQTEES